MNNNTTCIQIVKRYIEKKGASTELEILLNGIEKENFLYLDMIPTDLMKELMPKSTQLKWTRKADQSGRQAANN